MPAGDARPRIATNGHAIVAFTGQGSWILENLIFDGAGSPKGAAGVNLNFGRNTVYNVKVTNFAGNGFTGGADASAVLWSESGNNGGTGIAIGGQALVAYSWVHDNAGKGIQFSANLGTAVRNLVTNNGTTGIDLFYSGVSLENTIYGNGDAGVRASSNGVIANSLFVRNANGGVRDSWAPLLGGHNGFYGNTYGTYTTALTDLGVYPTDVSAPGAWSAVNSPFAHDVTSGPGDWTLKAGSVFRSVGLPGAMPGNVPNNLFDIGAYQSRTSGASGGERSCTFVR
jgi:hypothetical protein